MIQSVSQAVLADSMPDMWHYHKCVAQTGLGGKPFARVLVIDCQFYILLVWMLQEEPGEKSERKRSRSGIKGTKEGSALEVVYWSCSKGDRVKTNITQQHRCGNPSRIRIAINLFTQRMPRLSFQDVWVTSTRL